LDRMRLQFRLAGFLTLITLLAISFALVRAICSRVATIGNKAVSFGCLEWEYRAEISGVNAVVIDSSALRWKGLPIPQALLNRQATLKTPIGEFSVLNGKWTPHSTDPQWWSDDYQPPCFVDAKFVGRVDLVDEAIIRGYYETPVEGISVSGSWNSSRLAGTPSEWVYVSFGNKGFWTDPKMLDQLGEI
jgi:hypothetical protein